MFCLSLSVLPCPTWVFALILFLSICFLKFNLKIVELLPKASGQRHINVLSSSLAIECYETDINLLVFIDPFVLQLVDPNQSFKPIRQMYLLLNCICTRNMFKRCQFFNIHVFDQYLLSIQDTCISLL